MAQDLGLLKTIVMDAAVQASRQSIDLALHPDLFVDMTFQLCPPEDMKTAPFNANSSHDISNIPIQPLGGLVARRKMVGPSPKKYGVRGHVRLVTSGDTKEEKEARTSANYNSMKTLAQQLEGFFHEKCAEHSTAIGDPEWYTKNATKIQIHLITSFGT